MALLARARDGLGRHRQAVLFTISNLLPSLLGIALGPLVLRKVGLEEYGVLGLATYFLGIIVAYADFGAYAHLLSVFSKKAPDRHAHLASAFVLKGALLLASLAFLLVRSRLAPRNDDLFQLIGLYLLGALIGPLNVDWFFIARKRIENLFWSRLIQNLSQLSLVILWYFSPYHDALQFALISCLSAAMASLWLLRSLGASTVGRFLRDARAISFGKVYRLALRMFPIAASQLVTPYFLAYSLAWFSLCTPDKKEVGAFSVGYRLIIGFSSLVGPFVHFFMPRDISAQTKVPFGKILPIACAAGGAFWLIGIAFIRIYFKMSSMGEHWIPSVDRSFSILILGVILLSIRTFAAGHCLLDGHYLTYFFIHLISCAPILALSWGYSYPALSYWVPWLACIPDLLATSLFMIYYYGLAPATMARMR